MEEDGGVYKIPCKVNGLKLKFIFDTGAATVSISSAVANMMLENDYLTKDDIKGSGSSQIANGQIVDHTRIILKEIEIAGLKLNNIEAVVIHEQTAPLLLGQSAIQKLGKVSISGNKLVISSFGNSNPYQIKQNVYSESQLDKLYDEANSYRRAGNYLIAVEKYDVLYENEYLYLRDIQSYANCLGSGDVKRYDEALNIMLKYEQDIIDGNIAEKGFYYADICRYAYWAKEYSLSIKYGQLCQYASRFPLDDYTSVTYWMASSYKDTGDEYRARQTILDYINKYLKFMDISATDCWTKSYIDPVLADKYYSMYLFSTSNSDMEKYIIIAAAWGNENAIETCKDCEISYYQKPYKYVY